MVKIITLALLLTSMLMIISRPWLPAVVYSFFSMMQPQYVWPWAYQGYSVFTISAGLALVAWVIQMLKGQIDTRIYKSPQFIGLVLLTAVFNVSNIFSPFPSYNTAEAPSLVIGILNTITIMYFAILGVLNREQALKVLCWAIIAVTLYYTYWANDHYLSNNWAQFTLGRLGGPNGSPYRDGNVLSIVLVIGLSFVLCGLYVAKSQLVRVCIFLSVPLIWHALILFASRGALISAVVVTAFIAFKGNSRVISALVLACSISLVAWQGATLTDRTTATLNQANQSDSEEPLNARLISWEIGWNLTLMYPALGVGPQRFLHASAVHFPEKSHHVAHNTFLNFTANTGIFAGLIYLSFFYFSFKQYKYINHHVDRGTTCWYVNNSCMGAILGFFIGALFLDLIIFEPFYLLLALGSANYYMLLTRMDKQ